MGRVQGQGTVGKERAFPLFHPRKKGRSGNGGMELEGSRDIKIEEKGNAYFLKLY